jgi:hypothetical protein
MADPSIRIPLGSQFLRYHDRVAPIPRDRSLLDMKARVEAVVAARKFEQAIADLCEIAP